MSALVWAPLSRTAEQAQPSAGRFISVSLDKPVGHHTVGTHIVFPDLRKKKKKTDEAVLSCLHWKETGGLNEHELSLLLPFLALTRCICLGFFYFILQITFILRRHNQLPLLVAVVLGAVKLW